MEPRTPVSGSCTGETAPPAALIGARLRRPTKERPLRQRPRQLGLVAPVLVPRTCRLTAQHALATRSVRGGGALSQSQHDRYADEADFTHPLPAERRIEQYPQSAVRRGLAQHYDERIVATGVRYPAADREHFGGLTKKQPEPLAQILFRLQASMAPRTPRKPLTPLTVDRRVITQRIRPAQAARPRHWTLRRERPRHRHYRVHVLRLPRENEPLRQRTRLRINRTLRHVRRGGCCWRRSRAGRGGGLGRRCRRHLLWPVGIATAE